APPCGSALRPPSREGLIVQIAARLELEDDGTRDLGRGTTASQAPCKLARAEGTPGQEIERRELCALGAESCPLSTGAPASHTTPSSGRTSGATDPRRGRKDEMERARRAPTSCRRLRGCP